MKKTFKITVLDTTDNLKWNTDVQSYGIRYAIEDAEKELKSAFPAYYHNFEIVGVEKKEK